VIRGGERFIAHHHLTIEGVFLEERVVVSHRFGVAFLEG
jgi:hypothetical protein